MDREKVIKCLEACTGATDDCAGHTCPYWDFDGDVGCRTQMELDALALLKEQEAEIEKVKHENRTELLNERLDRLATVLDEIMPNCALLVRDALELLKEQEAVEPKITPWKTDDNGDVIVAKRQCGNCGWMFFTENPNFCENCGKPVKWDA